MLLRSLTTTNNPLRRNLQPALPLPLEVVAKEAVVLEDLRGRRDLNPLQPQKLQQLPSRK